MGTAKTCIDQEYSAEQMKAPLAALPAVDSVHLLPTETSLSVWVGIRDDDSATYRAIYSIEDQISEMFPTITFDFHVVPLQQGRKMEEYVTAACPVFQRHAA